MNTQLLQSVQRALANHLLSNYSAATMLAFLTIPNLRQKTQNYLRKLETMPKRIANGWTHRAQMTRTWTTRTQKSLKKSSKNYGSKKFISLLCYGSFLAILIDRRANICGKHNL